MGKSHSAELGNIFKWVGSSSSSLDQADHVVTGAQEQAAGSLHGVNSPVQHGSYSKEIDTYIFKGLSMNKSSATVGGTCADYCLHAVHRNAGNFLQAGIFGTATGDAKMMMGESCAAATSFSTRDHQDRVHGTTSSSNTLNLIPDDGLVKGFLPCPFYDHIQDRDIGCVNKARDVTLWHGNECAVELGLSLGPIIIIPDSNKPNSGEEDGLVKGGSIENILFLALWKDKGVKSCEVSSPAQGIHSVSICLLAPDIHTSVASPLRLSRVVGVRNM